MLNTTLQSINCPICQNQLALKPSESQEVSPVTATVEIRSGNLICSGCQARFPILAGVAILVDDVGQYIIDHVKGIAQAVSDSEIPKEYREAFLEAKSEIQTEHIEEDLEAERVNALYVMTHYLHANDRVESPWWMSSSGQGSPLIDSLVKEYWDHGPFAQIQKWLTAIAKSDTAFSMVELGCGVGGLYSKLQDKLSSYLGVDSSFASVAIGRHLALGMPYRGTLKFPEDLLQGTVSREIKFSKRAEFKGGADLIVGDAENPPVKHNVWDLTVALNIIDMLNEPETLPEMQKALLKEDGFAIQSSPYIWHSEIAKDLREAIPSDIRESHKAVEWLYQQSGFKIRDRVEHLPWLFFKHLRQLEIYSVHMILGKKGA